MTGLVAAAAAAHGVAVEDLPDVACHLAWGPVTSKAARGHQQGLSMIR